MAVKQLTAEMRRQGIRRLVVISGDPAWCLRQAQGWMAQLDGDWLWVGASDVGARYCAPAALHTLLGQEFRHAVFDARDGFHAEAFAALAGTLMAGSWLLLLVPVWSGWPTRHDNDSLRWSGRDTPISTPYFVDHFQQQLQLDGRVAIHLQGCPLRCPAPQTLPDWQPDPNTQQEQILQTLLQAKPGISILTAARGRGKSALAGMLIAGWPGKCRVTAPTKAAADVLARFAGAAFQFMAPDALLAQPPTDDIDWLVIDEAAAIPMPVLRRLIQACPRVLLTTTVQGYEGTGQGFLLKFCAGLPLADIYHLDIPLRWAPDDPLESIVARSLIFAEPEPILSTGTFHIQPLEQGDWQTQPQHLVALYQLLASAHYRTSPLDLRRLMDAPGMHFRVALTGDQQVCGALWLVDEGGITHDLAHSVWAGWRRPRGNLVAQSLAAHSGFIEAPQLRSLRVSRIAIAPSHRRQGLGDRLIAAARKTADGIDFLSVSFGFTDELWQFWQHCGFRLARVGLQREASSGCYVAMALLPLSAAGVSLAQRTQQRLRRDLYWLQPWINDTIPLTPLYQQQLNDDDWQELTGFAYALRPFEASLAALSRLLVTSQQPLPALRGSLMQRKSVSVMVTELRLSGRKALQQCWRQETQQALMALDAQRCEHAQQRLILL